MPKRYLGAALAIAVMSLPGALRAADSADIIWSGGPIYTMNDAQPSAEAVAVKNGKIVAVGTSADIMELKGDTTVVRDLKGLAMVPGFVDAHSHVYGVGVQAISANLLAPPDGKVENIPDVVQTLKDWASANKEIVDNVKIIVGFGYDEATLAEHHPPTAADLDQVSTDLPVYIVHQSGHIGVANSKMLQLAGITAASKNPPGGVIERIPGSDQPSGVLQEAAHFQVLFGMMSKLSPQGAEAIFKAGVELETSFGYTTADEGRATASQVAVMEAYAAANKLPIDVVAYPDVMNDAADAMKHSQDYVNRFRIGGGKLTIDGSPQGKTAWRDRPYYVVPPGSRADYVGYAAVTNDQAMDAIDAAFKNNYQILIHANGEAAIDLFIAGVREATAKYGNVDRRPVLVHGQFIREDQLDALKDLRIHPSFFPMHTFYWGDWHREQTVGPSLVDNISPTGWAVKRGMIFSSHTDAPVAFPDSMRVLSATVTRRSRSGDIIGPDQRVDVTTALKAMTIWPAYQHFEETTKGSIEVGKLADFVVLSGDPLAIDPETLADLKVVETIKEGVAVYVRPTDPAAVKKASLQYRPGAESDPFANMLAGAALSRDATRSGRLHPFALPVLRAAALGPHDPNCVYDVLFQSMSGVAPAVAAVP